MASDWAEWRGPARDGISLEKDLPAKWSTGGRQPGVESSIRWPLGADRYEQPRVSPEYSGQRRVRAGTRYGLDADTGKLLWEHRFNIFLAMCLRIAWVGLRRSATRPPAMFMRSASAALCSALTREGKVIWERSLGEDFGLLTTHGGRTVSPIIDGDLLIISGITFVWGPHARGAHRFMAFDKRTGETVWVSAPGGRPYDTTYAPPIIVNINGTRLLIQGASDGVVHAIKAQTGEPVWKYEISKRGINTGVVVHGTTAILTHSEENLDSSEMGMVVAVDASAKGELKKEQVKWSVYGWQGGFSSPVIDGDRFYHIDNGANIAAFEVATGKRLWLQNLGTIQRLRRCWLTASFMSALRMESSSS